MPPLACFIWIPRTGGNSVYSALKPLGLEKRNRIHDLQKRQTGRFLTFGHADYRQLIGHAIPRDFHKNAFRFAFVRHPLTRAVSLYRAMMHRGDARRLGLDFRDFCRLIRDRRFAPIGVYNLKGLSWCNAQVRWLENVRVDFLGRFEHLEHDFRRLCVRFLGLGDVELPHTHRTPGLYGVTHDRETARWIAHGWREDFKAFGYSMGSYA